MIQQLSIRNYALIEQLELNFKSQLTTITGETGSGKSILLGALGLILGKRADTTALQDKEKKCVVEGTFDLKDYARNYSINDFFRRYDLDYDHLTVIRREITPSGRSRAFINDTPVNLNQLRELTTQLVDIHSQHETLELGTTQFQRTVLDIYAGNEELLRKYTENYRAYKQLQDELKELREREHRAQQDADYYQFQYDELEQAELKAGEEQALELELKTLSNSEEIKRTLNSVSDLMNEGSGNVVASLQQARQLLSKVSEWVSDGESLESRLESAYIEISDLSYELSALIEKVDLDPRRLEVVNERLDVLNGLFQKHKVDDADGLIKLRDELEVRIAGIGSLAKQIVQKEAAVKASESDLIALADKLSDKRKKKAPALQKEVHNLLKQLAMPNAELDVKCIALPEPGPHGSDQVEFHFKANKGGHFNEIGKVASGGELSRLMLTIKSILARVKTLPTVIFDEIDTGISGDVADKTGNILSDMASTIQVIAITHLPQMASKGQHHWRVFKDHSGKSTVTQVVTLDEEGRVDEIAKMLSGEDLTEAARENARVLLKR